MKTKRYYIEIGLCNERDKVLYCKTKKRFEFTVSTLLNFDEKLLSETELFTEKEVENLKSTLPENMAKIVELGKVGINYDKDKARVM